MTEYLYVRYPEQQWQKFITTDTNKHQKDLIDKFTIKKIEKKRTLAEFILECITLSKENPKMTQHEIIKTAKKKWDK